MFGQAKQGEITSHSILEAFQNSEKYEDKNDRHS